MILRICLSVWYMYTLFEKGVPNNTSNKNDDDDENGYVWSIAEDRQKWSRSGSRQRRGLNKNATILL